MIPDAVKKQAEEAEELARKIAAEEQPIEEETPEEGETAEVVDLPAEEQEPQEEDWEHKYKVLQGKYNAEVPRLQEENRKLQDEMRLLREKLELLEQFIAQSQPKETPQAQPAEAEDEAVKQLKEDFPDIYTGVTKLLEQFERRIASLLEEKVRPVQETVEQTTMATFQARLSSLVPDWTELNTDSGFLEWLKAVDPFTGKTRHEMLLEAFEARDADRVARFFQAYKDEQQTPKKRPSQATTLPPSGESYTPSVGRRPQGRMWTAQEIKDFYTKKALGKISPEEASRTEAEILRALKEGRVHGTV